MIRCPFCAKPFETQDLLPIHKKWLHGSELPKKTSIEDFFGE